MSEPTRLRPILENLLVAQRALTRAAIKADPIARAATVVERDRCVRAIDEAFTALELAHAAAVAEQKRCENRELNLSLILTKIHQQHPDLVGTGIEAALMKINADPRITEGFLSCLGEAVEDGLAVRRGVDDVRITYAGVQNLVAAKRLRADVDMLRTELFRTEQRLRAAERQQASQPHTSANSQPRKVAVGE